MNTIQLIRYLIIKNKVFYTIYKLYFNRSKKPLASYYKSIAKINKYNQKLNKISQRWKDKHFTPKCVNKINKDIAYLEKAFILLNSNK